MEVRICGKDNDGNAKQVKWTLYAPKGNGPYIPTLSTIILARKLLSSSSDQTNQGTKLEAGAKPCVGLLQLSDFSASFDALALTFEENISLEAQEQET